MDNLVLSNFFFGHYVFKKPSAAEASESGYMWKKVKLLKMAQNLKTNKTYKSKYSISNVSKSFEDCSMKLNIIIRC